VLLKTWDGITYRGGNLDVGILRAERATLQLTFGPGRKPLCAPNSAPQMLRQAELWRVLGRRLTERLIRAGWIEPVHAQKRAIFFSARDIHRALSRLQSQGYLLDGHRVGTASVSASAKVRRSSAGDPLAGLELENLFPE
jgi:hypothetical protein